jgi:CubicO group peptidase (beta-lactamase class C family)
MKPSPKTHFSHPSAFGAPGAGGSFGFADPQAGVGYAYVLNRMGTYLEDPRELAMRTAMYRSLGETPPSRARPRRARLPKHDERALTVVRSWDVFWPCRRRPI